MTDASTQFTGSVPALYDRYLGPLIFEPYAEDLASRIHGLSPHRVLETAAGTGIVTAAMAKRLGDAQITATDLNPAMLEIAAAKPMGGAITWQPADAMALPFADGSFDAVVCQFGIMFFPDKLAGCREAFRVLKPGGAILLNVWDSLEFNEFPAVVSDAVAAFFADDPPLFLRRIPYGYHNKAVIAAVLKEAGFAHVTIDTVSKRAHAPSHRDPAIGFCQGSPLRSEIEARDPHRLEAVTQAAAEALASRFGRGPIEGTIQAIVVVAQR